MTEQEQKEAIERSNSYRQMMEMSAWKEFSEFLDHVRNSALEIAIEGSKMEDVQVQRGVVKCVDTIRGELNYILNGDKK